MEALKRAERDRKREQLLSDEVKEAKRDVDNQRSRVDSLNDQAKATAYRVEEALEQSQDALAHQAGLTEMVLALGDTIRGIITITTTNTAIIRDGED